MSLFAPRFFNIFNLTSILKAISMNACVAIGFTVVMICGQLDLSIGTVITFAGVLALGFQPSLGFTGSIVVAVVAGPSSEPSTAPGGQGEDQLVHSDPRHDDYPAGGDLPVLRRQLDQRLHSRRLRISDFLSKSFLPLITPRILISAVLVGYGGALPSPDPLGAELLPGRRQPEHGLARGDPHGPLHHRGLRALRQSTAAIGGVCSVLESTSATLKLGENSLMYVISGHDHRRHGDVGRARAGCCAASSRSSRWRCSTPVSFSSA